MRGEYCNRELTQASLPELPPRARRILIINQAVISVVGTTSACAENTDREPKITDIARNYLRVRGEYMSFCMLVRARAELPPRARRILTDLRIISITDGTTSACAENTLNELGLL